MTSIVRHLVLASALGLVVLPGEVLAATAKSGLGISASISSNCTISASAVAFGSHHLVATTLVPEPKGTATITTACTFGASSQITLAPGKDADRHPTLAAPAPDDGGDGMAYALYQDPDHTTLWGSTSVYGSGSVQHFTVYAAGSAKGSYLDTVVATVAF